jgi:hypothetical protein
MSIGELDQTRQKTRESLASAGGSDEQERLVRGTQNPKLMRMRRPTARREPPEEARRKRAPRAHA